MLRSVVGAGGKTSYIKQVAKEYVEKGLTVFVTTSTKMYVEEDTILSGNKDEILAHLEEKRYAMAGISVSDMRAEERANGQINRKYTDDRGEGEKFKSLPLDTFRSICTHADVVLVEADGSKHLPLKYPNESEPVLYEETDEIVIVCGMHALGKTVKEAVHRYELACEHLRLQPETMIDAEIIQNIVRKAYMEPLKEKYPNKQIVIEPRGAVTLYERAAAALIKADYDVNLIRKEWFVSQPTLIICGGGHVSCELVKIASSLDFYIKVIDDREEFANKERFPLAHEVICDTFDHLENYLESNAYYVVVTRGHKDDFVCVKTILGHSYQYLGMIGSKLKVEKTFENLEKEGINKEQIASIFAPIGLKLGAVTPAEIAISILAQIIQEKNKTHCASVSRELLHVKEKGMLCIIIGKSGSSPRGVGSMMLITEDKIYDSIGGGAVEFAVIEDAKSCTEVMIREYHLNNKDSIRLGMICGGSNQVLFVPL